MNPSTLDESYGTLSQTMLALNEQGYTLDFNLHEDSLVSHITDIQMAPEDFKIDKFYRFEGMTDPQDQSILYAISSDRFKVKGLLVNGYGAAADDYTTELIKKLNVHQEDRQNSNAATTLSESLTAFDLENLIANLKEEKSWTEKEHVAVTLYKSDTMRLVLMGLHENAEIKPHTAKGGISVQLLEGAIDFMAIGKTVRLEKNQMIALANGLTHGLVAQKESFVLLTLAVAH